MSNKLKVELGPTKVGTLGQREQFPNPITYRQYSARRNYPAMTTKGILLARWNQADTAALVTHLTQNPRSA